MYNYFMGLFTFDKELLKIIRIQAESLSFFSRRKCPPNSVHLALTTIINNSKFSFMGIQLQANQKISGTLSLIDSVTQQPIPGAVFSNIKATSDNPAAFNGVVNPDQSVEVVAVAAGAGNIKIDADVNFKNSLGIDTTLPVTQTIAVDIVAVPVANGVALVITWGPVLPQ
jgi:hypothetical protein